MSKPNGLDVDRLSALRVEHCDDLVSAYDPGAAIRTEDVVAVLNAPVDVLAPAARENVVQADIARSTIANLVVGGANMPTTVEAPPGTARPWSCCRPHLIANAGGIVAAAYSMGARTSPFTFDPATVFNAVSSTMRRSTRTVLEESARADQPSTRLPGRSPNSAYGPQFAPVEDFTEGR